MLIVCQIIKMFVVTIKNKVILLFLPAPNEQFISQLHAVSKQQRPHIVHLILPVKPALASLPWDILICIGAVSAIGTGLDVSGGGAIVAEAVLALFGGENASIIVLTVVICVLTSILTLFLQNSTVAALLSPIIISMALAMGISPIPWCVIAAIGTNLAIATPIGTAVNMQILPAGYTFKDFALIGGPLFIIMVAAVSVLGCVIYF